MMYTVNSYNDWFKFGTQAKYIKYSHTSRDGTRLGLFEGIYILGSFGLTSYEEEYYSKGLNEGDEVKIQEICDFDGFDEPIPMTLDELNVRVKEYKDKITYLKKSFLEDCDEFTIDERVVIVKFDEQTQKIISQRDAYIKDITLDNKNNIVLSFYDESKEIFYLKSNEKVIKISYE